VRLEEVWLEPSYWGSKYLRIMVGFGVQYTLGSHGRKVLELRSE
jgi:hypothetical protein